MSDGVSRLFGIAIFTPLPDPQGPMLLAGAMDLGGGWGDGSERGRDDLSVRSPDSYATPFLTPASTKDNLEAMLHAAPRPDDPQGAGEADAWATPAETPSRPPGVPGDPEPSPAAAHHSRACQRIACPSKICRRRRSPRPCTEPRAPPGSRRLAGGRPSRGGRRSRA